MRKPMGQAFKQRGVEKINVVAEGASSKKGS